MSWSELADGIRVRQSTQYWMNSVLLAGAGHAVLVDPGVLPGELDDLAAAVLGTGATHVTLVFTHGHWDHVLGRPWWPHAATVGHAGLGAELARDRDAILKEAVDHAAGAGETWRRGFEPFEPGTPVRGETRLDLGPFALVAREAPGHCDTQITLHLPERRLLFAGDMLSDLEIPWLDRETGAYRGTLASLLSLAEDGAVETLVPGHGAVARGRAAVLGRLRRDLRYLDELDAGVRAARAAGLGLDETQARLAGMDYTGKGAAYPMDEVHRGNVRIAWERAGEATG